MIKGTNWGTVNLRRKAAQGKLIGVDAEEQNPLRGLFEHEGDRSARLRDFLAYGPSGERDLAPLLDAMTFRVGPGPEASSPGHSETPGGAASLRRGAMIDEIPSRSVQWHQTTSLTTTLRVVVVGMLTLPPRDVRLIPSIWQSGGARKSSARRMASRRAHQRRYGGHGATGGSGDGYTY